MSRRKARAQVAMEFAILIGLMFIVMILFLAFILNYVVDVRSDKDRELLKDIAYAVQAEVHIAAGVMDGYERIFTIPELIDHINYTINITEEQVWARTPEAEVVLDIPAVVGNLTKGGNTIRKAGGIIYLNVGPVNDTDPPVITLISPADGSTDVDGDVIFSYIVSDVDSGIANCSFIFQGETNQTETGIVEGIAQYFYLDSLSNDDYNWSVNCTDNAPNNNTGQSANWTFDVVLVFNNPPSDPDSLTCDGASCNASFSDTIEIQCGGSTDTENDTITYVIDALYASSSFIFDKVEAESGSFSYSGGYTSTSSCICSGTSGTCIRDTTWSAGTWASASLTSAYGTTINRVHAYYCSENDGDDFHNTYSDAELKDSWTTSYEDNGWEMRLIDNVSLANGEEFELNCSRGTSSSYCRYDYVIFDDRGWSTIGNHSVGENLTWNISGYPDQDWADLRCRAVDLNGSGVYSDNYDPAVKLNITVGGGGGGGGASGATTNKGFNTSSSGWSGYDWDLDWFEVNPSTAYRDSDGDPSGCVRVRFGAGRWDEVGGYWQQPLDVTVNNPSDVTCQVGWYARDYEYQPNTFQAYMFLDDSSGEPSIGDEVWSSGEITGTTSWVNVSVNCTSKVTSADTYYFKIAVWLETDGGDYDGPYQVRFDNAQASWQE